MQAILGVNSCDSMSALRPKAVIAHAGWNVRFVPKANIGRPIDHLVGAGEQSPDQTIKNIRGDPPRLMAREQIANCGILVRVQVLALESHP